MEGETTRLDDCVNAFSVRMAFQARVAKTTIADVAAILIVTKSALTGALNSALSIDIQLQDVSSAHN